MPASPPTVSREFRRDRSLRRIPGLPFRLVGRAQTMSKLFPLRSCSTLCLGTASGLLRRPATAKPLLCLRPRPGSGSPGSGPPRKAASGLGSRAHSLPGARDRRAETEKRMYLNRITLIGFLGGDAEKKVSNTVNIAVFSLATKTSWKNDAGTRESRTGMASMRRLLEGGLNSPADSVKVLTWPSRVSCRSREVLVGDQRTA